MPVSRTPRRPGRPPQQSSKLYPIVYLAGRESDFPALSWVVPRGPHIPMRNNFRPRFMMRSTNARREALTFYLLISPWLIGFIVFLAYPMLRSLYLSFTSYNLLSPPIWV